jgi:hypothetical protein
LLHLCSKKRILPSGASLVNPFSKKAFGRASQKNKAEAKAPEESIPNRTLVWYIPSDFLGMFDHSVRSVVFDSDAVINSMNDILTCKEVCLLI